MTDAALLTVSAAAAALGVHPQTVRHWLRQGAPQGRRGRRGYGCAALLDPEALRAWRAGACAGAVPARVLAAELPELLAAAIHSVFLKVEGPHKREVAGTLAICWLFCSWAARDRLAIVDPDIPEITEVPELIERLRSINRNFGRVSFSRSPLDTKHA